MPIIRLNQKVGYFVHIPRCAGTSIEHYLGRVCENIGFLDPMYLRHPQHTLWNRSSPQHIDARSLGRLFRKKGFFDFTFAVVRHPYTRFMSAFRFQRDKEKKIPIDLGPEDFIAQIYRKGVQSIELGWMDNHFMPMTNFFPSATRVQLFKLEQGLQEFHRWFETKILLKPSGFFIPHINKGGRGRNTEPDHELGENAKRRLFDIYKKDFENFNYVPML